MEKYTFEGQGFEVKLEDLEAFKLQYPGATKVDEPGKTTSSADVIPTGGPNNMGLDLEDGSLEQPKERAASNWFGRRLVCR